jgi:ring-1,2-phenylacetyl-CoA epoxidase subunit PaaE
MGLFSRFKKTESTSKNKRSAELLVLKNEKLTADSCQISFTIPVELKADFQFIPGQYLNLHCLINNETVIRSYSICSGTNEALAVAVKRIPTGKASNWIFNELVAGSTILVDFPQGNFQVGDTEKSIVAFAAGSGITPILSMAKSLNETRIKLFYGNSAPESAMFLSDLTALSTVELFPFYTKSTIEGAGFGRFNKESVTEIVKADLSILNADGFYLCGPEEMIFNVNEVLTAFGVPKEKIHFELFTTPVLFAKKTDNDSTEFKGISKVTAMLDGEVVKIELDAAGKSILDALDQSGMDVPFSCKGGVCCTCKAKIIEGSASMNINYALTDEEVANGYILTCQAHPTSDVLKIDYDV